jgi:hypothetical protein
MSKDKAGTQQQIEDALLGQLKDYEIQTWRAFRAETGNCMGLHKYLYLRYLWRRAGGDFHGPNIETANMPESALLQLLEEIEELGSFADAVLLQWEKT